MPEKFLTVKDCADFLRCSEYTIRRRLRSGALRGSRGPLGWRIKVGDFNRFQRVETPYADEPTLTLGGARRAR